MDGPKDGKASITRTFAFGAQSPLPDTALTKCACRNVAVKLEIAAGRGQSPRRPPLYLHPHNLLI